MKITRYQAAADFLARAQASLERHEAANNLMISIVMRLKEHPERIKTPPYLATVEDDGALVAAAFMTPPQRVGIHSESAGPAVDPAPLRLIAADLIAGGWTVPGTIGSAEASRAFAEVWTAAAGGSLRLLRHLRVYELRQVTAPTGVPGILRVATELDLDLVARWNYAFHRDAGMEGTAEDTRESAERWIDDRNAFLWDDGQPVSMAVKGRHTTHGMTVGGVYTPSAFRRRGYAGACVAALSQQMLDAGWEFCTLFTDLANPTSNSVYQKIGYRSVRDFDEYVFE
jgi:uncharacterized protein